MVKTKKIKGKIVEAGMTQAELAHQMGMSAPTLSLKLRGERPFSLVEAEKIIELLHLPREAVMELFF